MEERIKSIVLLVTHNCNLRCTYCYEPTKDHHFMTPEMCKQVIVKTIEEMDQEYTSVSIEFMGGEPLMQFNLIKEVSEWLWSSKFRVPISSISAPTNGTLLNGEMKEWFSQNKDRFELSLSFDGDRLMQNINRSNSSSHVDLDYFVNTFPDVPIKMTLSPATLPYYYSGVKYLHEKGFNSVGANLALGEKVGWKQSDLRVLQEQLDLLVDYYVEHPELLRIAYLDIPVWNILDQTMPETRCKLGKDMVCYDYDGLDYPCHLFSPITMDKETASRSRILNTDTINNSTYSKCTKCVLRNVCTRCYGFNYMESGDCNITSAFHCAQFKLYFFANCKLQKILATKNNDIEKSNLVDAVIQLLTNKN